uniref:Uncharacterized protein AlNc14C36G3174 n=1 Tax=Albugo laibachii Nc14 TaxID=890382 RepID=F0W8P8_9STRA|nr:conserved hypothetical protein [Albugo laibachii Nc14]|eukprot:CCA17505.1 conserved hypothetical protein [Albugo laibachii Nc14]
MHVISNPSPPYPTLVLGPPGNSSKKSASIIVTRIPKFLRSLYDILHTEDRSIIAWSLDGKYFEIFDIKRLENQVLPKYFKHSKFASFQRQLNNFGFRKWTKTQSSVCTFSHQFYVQQHPDDLMELLMRNIESIAIKRRRRACKGSGSCNNSPGSFERRKRRSFSSSEFMEQTFEDLETDTLSSGTSVPEKQLFYQGHSEHASISIACSEANHTDGRATQPWNLVPLELMKGCYSDGAIVGHDSPTTICEGAEFIDIYPPELLDEILQSAADFMEDNNTRHLRTYCSNQQHENMMSLPPTCPSSIPLAWNHDSMNLGLSYRSRGSYLYPRPTCSLGLHETAMKCDSITS